MPDNATEQTVPLVLAAKEISKAFKTPRGPLEVLHRISLEIRAGEFASIRGESGSGKTTLLQILGGLDKAGAGELYWNGERVSGRSNGFLANRRARWLGYVFQAYHLVPELTALENVVLAGQIAGRKKGEVREQAEFLLKRVGLAERLRHLPSQMSGGECQRVAVARALVNQPKLVLADEPTGNLDERTGQEVMQLLKQLTAEERVALVLVTHNMDFARQAGRCFLLQHGGLQLAAE